MKRKIVIFFKRQYLLFKLRSAKENKRYIVQIWAATGKGIQPAVNILYDKYQSQIDFLESQIKMLK
jgi:hypothetical protein